MSSVLGTQGALRINGYGCDRLSSPLYISYDYPTPNSIEGPGEQCRGTRWTSELATKRGKEVQRGSYGDVSSPEKGSLCGYSTQPSISVLTAAFSQDEGSF